MEVVRGRLIPRRLNGQTWRFSFSTLHHIVQWFPTFCDAFLPLLILELFIPPLWNFQFLPCLDS